MNNVPAPRHGQSFTAPTDGVVTQLGLALQSAPGTRLSLAIYEGA